MAEKLKGKSAVVTGAGGGIGRAVALNMAAEGAAVVVNDIGKRPDGTRAADGVVAEIIKAGGAAVANYDSVTLFESGAQIVETAVGNFGKLDILVNCAGNFKPLPTIDTTKEDWYSTVEVHLSGHFICGRAAAAEMLKRKSGRIINISSRGAVGSPSGKYGGFGSVAYSAAKAGILGLTASMAGEFRNSGITVNAVLPRARTELFNAGEIPGDTMPTAQWFEPEYVTPIIVYLATDEAQGITGRYIYASGGDLMIYPRLFQLAGPSKVFLRKIGKWTIDELSEALPPLAK